MTEEAIAAYDSSIDKKKQRGDFLEFLRKTQEKDPIRLPDRKLEGALFVNL